MLFYLSYYFIKHYELSLIIGFSIYLLCINNYKSFYYSLIIPFDLFFLNQKIIKDSKNIETVQNKDEYLSYEITNKNLTNLNKENESKLTKFCKPVIEKIMPSLIKNTIKNLFPKMNGVGFKKLGTQLVFGKK